MPDVAPTTPLPLATAGVAGSVPGRLRLRLAPTGQGRARLAAAAADLAVHADILVASPRPRSGSLVIRYDPAHGDAVMTALEALGLRAQGSAGGSPASVADQSTRMTDAVRAIDGMVARRTGGHELRTLLPLGLAMLAARQAVRGEQRLVDAPWYVLAWYASETFQKLQLSRGEDDG